MFLLALIAAWATLTTGIITVGWLLDSGMDANPEAKRRLGQLLLGGTSTGLTRWLQGVNQSFLNLFDRAYVRENTRLTDALWVGLLFAPIVLLLTRGCFVLIGFSRINTSQLLFVALVITLVIATLGYFQRLRWRIGEKPGPLRSTIRTRKRFIQYLIIAASMTVAASFAYTTDSFPTPIKMAVIGVAGYYVCSWIAISSVIIPMNRFLINPLRALASSMIFLFALSITWGNVGWNFLSSILEEPLVLSFVAFNVFADSVSLWETRWVLQRGAAAGASKLVALLTLDFILSGIIYLVLPLALWPQILEFQDAWRFQGERSWLGLMFWTTFSTSFIFYLFVASALLVRPLRALAIGFRGIGKLFDLEKHPVRCLSVAMAVVVTLIFGGVGVWEFVSGFGSAL